MHETMEQTRHRIATTDDRQYSEGGEDCKTNHTDGNDMILVHPQAMLEIIDLRKAASNCQDRALLKHKKEHACYHHSVTKGECVWEIQTNVMHDTLKNA